MFILWFYYIFKIIFELFKVDSDYLVFIKPFDIRTGDGTAVNHSNALLFSREINVLKNLLNCYIGYIILLAEIAENLNKGVRWVTMRQTIFLQ